jgi:hypothetical protein
MKLIQGIPELEAGPLVFLIESFDENSAHELLANVLEKAKEVIGVVTEAYNEVWTAAPPTEVRAVFGVWLVEAYRHFLSTIYLCEEHDLSVVANVHHRQIFEIYIQVRYYASLDLIAKEKCAEKIFAIGCIEYLENISPLKDHAQYISAYEEIATALSHCNSELVNEIKRERSKKRQYNWFGSSFSQLAENVNQSGEDLRRVYGIISADVHGTSRLALDVHNPKPGHLDFRGYPNVTTLYIRAAELISQIIGLYMNLWNEIAKSVGAQCVYIVTES